MTHTKCHQYPSFIIPFTGHITQIISGGDEFTNRQNGPVYIPDEMATQMFHILRNFLELRKSPHHSHLLFQFTNSMHFLNIPKILR